MKPLVSIVILNWNGRKHLEKFLPAVLATAYVNFRVIVADNGSSDDSVAFLQAAFPTVAIIENGQNYGFARGYNKALEGLESDYYVLLNSDVEVSPSWIDPVITLMEANPAIAACQPKLLQYHDKTSFEYSGACGGWIDRFGYPFARGRIFDVCERDHGQYDTTEAIFWASGAAMFVKTKVYRQLGGLDDFFFAHQEEIDFCWRLQRAGYLAYCCPESVVYHVGGGTLPKGNSNKVFLNFRNNLVMMAKNMPAGEAFWKIGMRFLLDAVSAVKSLAAGEGSYFVAVIRAHFSFLGWLFFEKKNKQTGLKRGVKLKGYLRKSIVWAYFVLGKKTFNEIVSGKS